MFIKDQSINIPHTFHHEARNRSNNRICEISQLGNSGLWSWPWRGSATSERLASCAHGFTQTNTLNLGDDVDIQLTCALIQVRQFLVSFQYLVNVDAHNIHHLYR